MSAETDPLIESPVYHFNADQGRMSLLARWREIMRYRYLLRNLVVRNLKARYKNSALGIVWSLLNPLLMMVVFTLLFTFRGTDIRQFPVFVLVGLIPWTFFTSSLVSGTTSVMGSASLVKKVYFPRELLPTSTLLSNLVNFAIAFLVLVVLLYLFVIVLSVYALWVPAILLTQLIFTLGLVLLLSALTVFYKDVLMILDVVLLAWFFMTPIFYSLDEFGTSVTMMGITFNPAQVMRWINPMASIIDGYRTVLWGTTTSTGPVSMDPTYLLRTLATSIVILIVGYAAFLRLEPAFGEKL